MNFDIENKDIDNVDSQDNFDIPDDDLSFDPGFESMGGIPPMERHQELLKQLMNFSPYMKDKFNGWLGITWDEKRGKYVQNKLLKPVMNIRGASWCVSYMNTYARDNNMITHIGKEEYDYLREDITETVWYNLGTRAEEFGITDYGDIMRVADEIVNSCFLVLMGAGDGKTAKLLSETTNRNENIVTNNVPIQNPREQQRKGLISGIFSGVKRMFTGGATQ